MILIPLFIILYGIFIGIGFITVTWTFIFDIIIFFALTFCGIIIVDAIGYFIGLMTFFTEHMFGLNMMKSVISSFLSGGMIPLSFMGAFGVFCSYTPFAFMTSTPILTLMGMIPTTQGAIYVAVAIGWVIILEVINKLIFNFCVKRLSVQGG
jgi:ABC-2 type transport system permease protein